MTRLILVLQAYCELIAHDCFMTRHDFASLLQRVKAFPVRQIPVAPHKTASVTSALEIACSFYPKQVLCLQRSAVLAKMLRSHGIRARMVIGTQKLPFIAHAWIEIDGQVVRDRLATREKFLILEVC